MLQSEFFQRTRVQLTEEQYSEVESIYNRVQMDKDEFCRLWKRDDKIIAELMTYIKGVEKKLAAIEKVNKEFEEKTAADIARQHERLLDFGRKIVINFEDDTRIYDACEEEFGLDFICKVKLENNMELEQHERAHLLAKL